MTNARDVAVGLAVKAGRVGATTGKVVLFPARVVARSPLAAPFRGPAEGLAETGRNAEVDARRRIGSVAGGVLAAPEAEQVVDGVLAGELPEAIARSLIEHRVIERVVVEALARAELDGELVSVREADAERLVAQVLESPALERILADALDSKLTLDLTDRIVRSPAFTLALTHILSSAEVRHALMGQSMSLAEEVAGGLRARLRRLDDAIERGPRRWFRRSPRTTSVHYGGIATRGLALAVDAALAALIFLTVTAVVGFVVSLVWDPGPATIVGSGIGGAGLLFEVAYFAGFWSTAGQTPGMRMMQLRVVDGSGSPPGLGRSLVRVVGLGLSILLLFTGFLPVLVNSRRRALQDFLAGTTVIHAEDAPQAVRPPSTQALDSLRQGA